MISSLQKKILFAYQKAINEIERLAFRIIKSNRMEITYSESDFENKKNDKTTKKIKIKYGDKDFDNKDSSLPSSSQKKIHLSNTNQNCSFCLEKLILDEDVKLCNCGSVIHTKCLEEEGIKKCPNCDKKLL